MPSTPLTSRSGQLMMKTFIWGTMIQVLLVVYVFYQSYEGRETVVHAQRAGCERSKNDRKANAAGWRIAEKARRDGGQILVANHYRDIASQLEKRSRIPCNKAVPQAGIFP